MAEKEEYNLTAGKFQKLCGTTRETLRYYRRQGLLIPYVDTQNGYTMYSSRQAATFYVVHIFRELGYSVSQIRALMDNEQSFSDFISLRQETLQQQRKELDEKIAVIEKIQSILDVIRSMETCVPQVISLPDELYIRSTAVVSKSAVSAADIVSDLHRHMEQSDGNIYRAVPMGVTVKLDNFASGKYIYDTVFSFCEKDDTDIIKNINILKTAKKAAVVACSDDDGNIENIYSILWNYILTNDLRPVSDVYILNVLNTLNQLSYHRYIKLVLIPVRKEV